MTIKKLRLLLVVFTSLQFFISTGKAQEIDYKGLPQWSWHKEDSTEYFLYTPENMEAGKKYPVVLFMHGCCGELSFFDSGLVSAHSRCFLKEV